MANLRAVLFDLDDTLTDRFRSVDRFAGRFLEQFGEELGGCGIEEVVRAMHASDRGGYASREEVGDFLQAGLPWRNAPGAKRLVEFWRENFPGCNVERLGAKAVLETLRRKGLKLAVVSNGSTFSQNTKIDVLGFRPLLDAVIVSETVGVKKPDRRIYEMGLAEVGASPSEAIFIGDNPMLDVAGPMAVGIRAVWLNCRGAAVPVGLSCPKIIESLDQVAALCEW